MSSLGEYTIHRNNKVVTKRIFDPKISYCLAVLSGIFLLLSYPPFNFGAILAWFALVPVLVAIYYETRAERVARFVFITALFIFPLFIWISYDATVIFGIIGKIIGVVAGFGLACYVIWSARDCCKLKNVHEQHFRYLSLDWLIFAIPVLATALEFLLLNLPVVMKVGQVLGFFSLSKTQWLNPPILQLASFTGMYGVTFLVWLVNTSLAYGVIKYQEKRIISKRTVGMLMLLGIIFVCGWINIPEAVSGNTTIALIQAKPDRLETERLNELYINISESSLKYNPEIISWSTWVMPFKEYKGSGSPGLGPDPGQYVDFCKEHKVSLTSGETTTFPNGKRQYYMDPSHYIYFFEGIMPFDPQKIIPKAYGFDSESGRFGFLTCMGVPATLTTNSLIDDGVQFVIGFTGNTSFVLDEVPAFFRASMVYRAVENRIYTALSYRDRGSVIIDPYGRLVEDFALEREIVAGKISFLDAETFYSKSGDLFGWIIVVLLFVFLIYNFYLERKSPFKYCQWCGAQVEKEETVCPKCGQKPEKNRWEKTDLYQLWRKISKK